MPKGLTACIRCRAVDGTFDTVSAGQCADFFHRVIAVGGPTASGKTALSVALAKTFDGEIINADSMQHGFWITLMSRPRRTTRYSAERE